MEQFKLYRMIKKVHPRAHILVSSNDNRVLQFLDEKPA